MNIVVHGLGIIGASICASLKKAGYRVYGKNRSREPVEFALAHGYIDGEATSYENADVVFLALPPEITMKLLDEGDFPDGCVVSDICGVKGAPERVVLSKPRSYRYVGIHPMAGKETSGIRSASCDLFRGANLVIARNTETDGEALSLVRTLASDMGFSRMTECTAEKHDEMIALTSQLAHVVSSAYVKRPDIADCAGFTGGSFQDMTRVAGVDEKVWTELYFLNAEYLLPEIDRVISCLSDYREALRGRDGEKMRELIREGMVFRKRFFPTGKDS